MDEDLYRSIKGRERQGIMKKRTKLQTPQMLHMKCWAWNLTLIAG